MILDAMRIAVSHCIFHICPVPVWSPRPLAEVYISEVRCSTYELYQSLWLIETLTFHDIP